MSTLTTEYPRIIQGGMGAGVSNWRLANAVSKQGALGVVSGTALDQIFVRRIQDGDPGGHMRRALDNFPFPEMAERAWKKYYIPGGKGPMDSYTKIPMPDVSGPREFRELCIVGNFVEVFLAREGHSNPVGINYLEKLQLPHLPSIYGAILAGVGYILMGAGIPLKIPGVLDLLAKHEVATYPLVVTGAKEGEHTIITFSPHDYMERELPPLTRPKFLPIIASSVLALTLAKKANGRVDGFIVEGPTAGGHNAPPRGKLQLTEKGEPIYGERDKVDLAKLRELGLPFWLAGGYGKAGMLKEALSEGAAGIQVGTPFAFCAESGMKEEYKSALIAKAVAGKSRIFTDATASPTGFPFKVALLEGTASEKDVYLKRSRICDLGYLREAYRREDGTVDFRCSSEPVSIYISKGGTAEEAAGHKCLCNALMANIGLGQIRAKKHVEPGLVTAGDALEDVPRFLNGNKTSYTAADVLRHLMNGSESE